MTPRLVRIAWEDSRQHNGAWAYMDDLPRPSPVQCASVGWLVGESGTCYTLAPTLGDLGPDGQPVQCAGTIQIPVRCVIEMIDLVPPNPPSAPPPG